MWINESSYISLLLFFINQNHKPVCATNLKLYTQCTFGYLYIRSKNLLCRRVILLVLEKSKLLRPHPLRSITIRHKCAVQPRKNLSKTAFKTWVFCIRRASVPPARASAMCPPCMYTVHITWQGPCGLACIPQSKFWRQDTFLAVSDLPQSLDKHYTLG